MLGARTVGKTLLVNTMKKQYKHDSNKLLYIPTIGVEHSRCTVGKCEFEIWDSSGNQRYEAVVRTFFRGCNLGIFVYRSQRSFDRLHPLISYFKTCTKSAFRIVIVSTENMPELGQALSREYGYYFRHVDPFNSAQVHDCFDNIEKYIVKEQHGTNFIQQREQRETLSVNLERSCEDSSCLKLYCI
jgi:GTPase SAR1 family protein